MNSDVRRRVGPGIILLVILLLGELSLLIYLGLLL
jgi:hypothetical protein